jgi:putative peptidoglycan lipid II flippase
LPAYILGKVLIPGYFARGDTKTPVKIAAISLIVNTSLNLALIGPYGHVGLAAATAISAWINVIFLYIFLHRKSHFSLNKTTIVSTVKYLITAILMGLILKLLSDYLQPYFNQNELTKMLALSTLIISGVLFYFTALIISGTLRLVDIKRMVSKGR